MPRSWPPSAWLKLTGVAHALIGLVSFRGTLSGIVRDRLLRGTGPEHGESATAFWFLVLAPTAWTAGRLLRSAEEAGDLDAQRVTGRVLAATGLAGGVALPRSGFWALLGIGLATLRRGRAAASTARAFDTFAARQAAMYGGADTDVVARHLAPDVVWHVPGTSAIAGTHSGRAAVVDYFTRRRAIAGGAMRIEPRGRMVSDDVVVQLADGVVTVEGEVRRWRTAGVYRMRGHEVAEAWLVPFDSAAFDAIWHRLAGAAES